MENPSDRPLPYIRPDDPLPTTGWGADLAPLYPLAVCLLFLVVHLLHGR